MVWLVNREALVLLAGGRALLLQLAHPAVAAGVDEHSDYREHPIRRLWRTLDLTLRLAFGDSSGRRGAARQINDAHRTVRGEGYRANDPALLLWVHATLIDSALDAYERFVAPLSAAEREAYYTETKPLGALLGLPASAYPATYADFAAWWQRMLDGDELRVDERARGLCRAVLQPKISLLPRSLWRPLVALTAGLLPPPIREAYELPWGSRERRLSARLTQVLRAARHLPAPLRCVPIAQRAARHAGTSSRGEIRRGPA